MTRSGNLSREIEGKSMQRKRKILNFGINEGNLTREMGSREQKGNYREAVEKMGKRRPRRRKTYLTGEYRRLRLSKAWAGSET